MAEECFVQQFKGDGHLIAIPNLFARQGVGKLVPIEVSRRGPVWPAPLTVGNLAYPLGSVGGNGREISRLNQE
ncbi:hypothetical protein BFP70_12945 [Thioclava sp. SK-1]|nr:hypothetical protein BFP70_12945 [Thioclava sp. SK-1]